MLRAILCLALLLVGSSAPAKGVGKSKQKKAKLAATHNGMGMAFTLPFKAKALDNKLAKKVAVRWGAPTYLNFVGYANPAKSRERIVAGSETVSTKKKAELLKSKPDFLKAKPVYSKVGSKKGFRLDVFKVAKGKYVAWVSHYARKGFANYIAVLKPTLKQARAAGLKLGVAAKVKAVEKLSYRPKAKKPIKSKVPSQVEETTSSDDLPFYIAVGSAVFALLLVGGAALFTNPPPGKSDRDEHGEPSLNITGPDDRIAA